MSILSFFFLHFFQQIYLGLRFFVVVVSVSQVERVQENEPGDQAEGGTAKEVDNFVLVRSGDRFSVNANESEERLHTEEQVEWVDL